MTDLMGPSPVDQGFEVFSGGIHIQCQPGPQSTLRLGDACQIQDLPKFVKATGQARVGASLIHSSGVQLECQIGASRESESIGIALAETVRVEPYRRQSGCG